MYYHVASAWLTFLPVQEEVMQMAAVRVQYCSILCSCILGFQLCDIVSKQSLAEAARHTVSCDNGQEPV